MFTLSLILSFAWWFTSWTFSLSDADSNESCQFYLGPSTIPSAGRGIIAGKFFSKDDFVEEGVTFTVPSVYARRWQLWNYVYNNDDDDDDDDDDDHSIVACGLSMLYNHHPIVDSVNLKHYWSSYPVTDIFDQREAHTTFTPVFLYSEYIFIFINIT